MMFRKVCAYSALASLVLVAPGCTRRDDQSARERRQPAPAAEAPQPPPVEKDRAMVRFVNAYNGSVDLFFGDTKTFAGVAYKSVTPYREIREDWAQFKLRPAGRDTADPIATNVEVVSDGERYTIVALGTDEGKAVLKALKDDEAAVPERARVRIVHAARDTGDIDIVPANKQEPVFDGLRPDSVADYKEIEPTARTLEIRKDNQQRPIARIAGLKAGSYTFVLAPSKTKGGLDVIRLTGETTPTQGESRARTPESPAR